MKILLAVDGAPHSESVIEFLVRMPWGSRTRVLVLTAEPAPIPVLTEASVLLSDRYADRLYDRHLRDEDRISMIERELRHSGFETAGLTVRGEPGASIVRVAREEHCDLIVMGTHNDDESGRTGGAVAAYVVGHAPCSVTIVRSAPLTD